MPDHPGLRDDLSDVGLGYSELENVSHYVDGELRLRPGLSRRMAAGGSVLTELFDPVDGAFAIHVKPDGTVTSTQPGNHTASNSLGSGYSVAQRATHARSNGRVYLTNNFDDVKCVPSGKASMRDAGMATPSVLSGADQTNAGNVTAGDHLVRYRWYDTRTGYYSSPSTAAAVTAPGSRTIEYGVGSGSDVDTDDAPSHANQVILQMTVASGTTYYDAAYVDLTSSTAVIDITDTNLALQDQTGTDAGADANKPPIASIVTEFRKRLWLIGAEPRSLTATMNAGTSVTGSGFSTNWVGYVLRAGNDATATEYVISAATSTTLTLATAYAGTTGSQTVTIYKKRPDELFWSDAGYPEQFPVGNARFVFSDEADTPTGMIGVGSELYIFGRHNISILSFSDDPANGSLSQLSGDLGLWNQHCLVKVGHVVYGWGPGGAWRMAGSIPVHIGRPIEAESRLEGIRMDDTYAAKFSGVYDPRERCIWWFYVPTGETEPKSAFVYDTDSGKWRTASFQQGITSAGLLRDENGQLRACVGDQNGYSWFLKIGVYDGVESAFDAVVTTDSGATTTVIPTTATLQTSPSLAGAYLYDPIQGEYRLISSNTASAITCSAFSGTPPVGRELYIGPIDYAIATKWLVRDPAIKSRCGKAYVVMRSTSGGGQSTIGIHKDFEGNPLSYSSLADDAEMDGVTINADGTLTIDHDGGTASEDGYIPINGFSDHARFWKLRLSGNRPEGSFRLIDMGIDQKRSDSAKVMEE